MAKKKLKLGPEPDDVLALKQRLLELGDQLTNDRAFVLLDNDEDLARRALACFSEQCVRIREQKREAEYDPNWWEDDDDYQAILAVERLYSGLVQLMRICIGRLIDEREVGKAAGAVYSCSDVAALLSLTPTQTASLNILVNRSATSAGGIVVKPDGR